MGKSDQSNKSVDQNTGVLTTLSKPDMNNNYLNPPSLSSGGKTLFNSSYDASGQRVLAPKFRQKMDRSTYASDGFSILYEGTCYWILLLNGHSQDPSSTSSTENAKSTALIPRNESETCSKLKSKSSESVESFYSCVATLCPSDRDTNYKNDSELEFTALPSIGIQTEGKQVYELPEATSNGNNSTADDPAKSSKRNTNSIPVTKRKRFVLSEPFKPVPLPPSRKTKNQASNNRAIPLISIKPNRSVFPSRAASIQNPICNDNKGVPKSKPISKLKPEWR